MKRLVIFSFAMLLLLLSAGCALRQGTFGNRIQPSTAKASSIPTAATETPSPTQGGATPGPVHNSTTPDPTQSQIVLPTKTICLIDEYGNGMIRLGMSSDELIQITREYSMNTMDDIDWSKDEDGLVINISFRQSPTSKGLQIGAAKEDMIRLYGGHFIDIGAGPGEDSFVYKLGENSVYFQFFDHKKEVLTGWGMTSIPEFTWDELEKYLTPEDER